MSWSSLLSSRRSAVCKSGASFPREISVSGSGISRAGASSGAVDGRLGAFGWLGVRRRPRARTLFATIVRTSSGPSGGPSRTVGRYCLSALLIALGWRQRLLEGSPRLQELVRVEDAEAAVRRLARYQRLDLADDRSP